MKKLIAIVITFIFIFDGTGYCLRMSMENNIPRVSKAIENLTSQRGFSGLDNSIYTPVISKKIRDGEFYAVEVKDGKFVPAKLDYKSWEGARPEKRGRDISSKHLELLNNASDIEKPEGAIFLFINGLDYEIYHGIEYKSRPENCFGSHYGIERNQYYLDTRHLFNTKSLKSQIWHEVTERKDVISGLSEEEIKTPSSKRPQELQEKIAKLAKESHDRLATQDTQDREKYVRDIENIIKSRKGVIPIIIDENLGYSRDGYSSSDSAIERQLEEMQKSEKDFILFSHFGSIDSFRQKIAAYEKQKKIR